MEVPERAPAGFFGFFDPDELVFHQQQSRLRAEATSVRRMDSALSRVQANHPTKPPAQRDPGRVVLSRWMLGLSCARPCDARWDG